jgi:hypothetical protein
VLAHNFISVIRNSLRYVVVQKAYLTDGKGTVGLVRGYFGSTVRAILVVSGYDSTKFS